MVAGVDSVENGGLCVGRVGVVESRTGTGMEAGVEGVVRAGGPVEAVGGVGEGKGEGGGRDLRGGRGGVLCAARVIGRRWHRVCGWVCEESGARRVVGAEGRRQRQRLIRDSRGAGLASLKKLQR